MKYIRKREGLRVGEGQKQQGRREPADQSDHQLDPDEAMHQAAMNVPRQRAADSHGEEVTPDDGGKLEDAVADQVTGQRPRDELVNQAAGGDQEDGYEKNQCHTSLSACGALPDVPALHLVDCRGDNQAQAQRERADQNRQRDVVLVNDLVPEMVGRQLIQNVKGDHEDQNADTGKHQRVQCWETSR
jgi:hypothetical protein